MYTVKPLLKEIALNLQDVNNNNKTVLNKKEKTMFVKDSK